LDDALQYFEKWENDDKQSGVPPPFDPYQLQKVTQGLSMLAEELGDVVQN
jgi:hypothetical protein